MQEDDRLVRERAEARVDTGHDVTNTAKEFVLLCRLKRDLYKDNFATEVRVLVQESFEGKEFVAHALKK